MQLGPLQKLSVTAGAAFVVVGLFAAVSYYYASRLVEADRAVERANTNISAAFRVVVGRQDAERATKAYIIRKDSLSSSALQDAQASVEDALDVMERGSEDNPRQHHLLEELGRRTAASFDVFRLTVLIRDHVGADSARRFLAGDLPATATDSLMKILDQMREEELRVLGERTRIQSERGANAQRIILLGMVLTFLLAGVALQPMRTGVATRLTSRILRDGVAGISELAAAARAHATSASAQLRAVHQLVAALSGARDAASGAKALVTAAVPALNATLAAVIVPNGAGGFSVLAASHAAFESVGPELAHPVAEALRTAETAMVESRSERERRWGLLTALDTCGARGAALFVPMTNEGAVDGVFIVVHSADHSFADDELTLATTLGRLGGPAVHSRPIIA